MKHGSALVGVGLVIALGAGCARGNGTRAKGPTVIASSTGWKATFPEDLTHVALKSAAGYPSGEVAVNLDSSTPLTSLPNQTGQWIVQANKADPFRGRVVFQDTVPALASDPTNREQPFIRKDGTIAAVLTVNQELVDARVTARMNATGGPEGKGSFSRQGAMLRWNGANEYSTCFIDFGLNQVYLFAARNAFEYETLGKQSVELDNTKSYRVDYEVRGQASRCRVFDGDKVVADTGSIVDAKMPARGSSGILFELSQGKPDVPLEGSASEIESAALVSTTGPSTNQPTR